MPSSGCELRVSGLVVKVPNKSSGVTPGGGVTLVGLMVDDVGRVGGDGGGGGGETPAKLNTSSSGS